MYQLQRVVSFQKLCRSAYCCKRQLTDSTFPHQSSKPFKSPATPSQSLDPTSLLSDTGSSHQLPVLPDPDTVRFLPPLAKLQTHDASSVSYSSSTSTLPISTDYKSSRHATPSSELSSIFHEEFKNKHREIFGGKF